MDNVKQNVMQICSRCSAEIAPEDCREIDGQILCEDCWQEETTTCVCCSERIWQENN